MEQLFVGNMEANKTTST